MSADRLDLLLEEIEPRVLLGSGAALLSLCVLAMVLYVIKPAWQELARLELRHAEALAAMPSAETFAPGPELSVLEAEVATLRDSLYGEAAKVPRSRIESFVVEALDRVSGDHDVALRGITPDEPSAVWTFDELPYDVTAEGSYFAIHRWLYDVERELRPMVVKQFDLKPSNDGTRVLIDLRIVAYRAADEIAP